jgi:3-dehydroquinate dehydratase-2
MSKKLQVIHGPNLNLLGQRDQSVYGKMTLDDINQQIVSYAENIGFNCQCDQYNSETDIINAIQTHGNSVDGIIINPAAFTHTSIAIRDAIEAINCSVVEVHISNVHQREEFRHTSLTAAVCAGQIVGFGWQGYLLAIDSFNHQ